MRGVEESASKNSCTLLSFYRIGLVAYDKEW